MKRARAEREGCGKLSKGDYEELKRLRAENADLVDDGWSVSEKTVAELMRYQALAARWIKRRSGLTCRTRPVPKFSDLIKAGLHRGSSEHQLGGRYDRDPHRSNGRGPKLYLATVIDL